MPSTCFQLLPTQALELPLEEAVERLRAGEGMVWVDLEHPSQTEASLLHDLGFHPLAVEDTVSPALHPPKVEEFDDHVFLIVHGINYGSEADLVETTELNLFIGPTYVVSSHNEPLLPPGTIAEALRQGKRPVRDTADFFAHTLLAALGENMMPMIDQMADAADLLDAEAIRQPRQSTLEGLLKLKRSASRLFRLLVPQREAMETLASVAHPQIGAEAARYFRNLNDRMFRLEDRVRNLMDRADNAVAIYMSSVANRQNETMKTLSIVASIFLPMSLVAGIYGMNFENMPELGVPWAYYAALGFMAFLGSSIAAALWLRTWLKWGRDRSRWIRPFTVEVAQLIRLPVLPEPTMRRPNNES